MIPIANIQVMHKSSSATRIALEASGGTRCTGAVAKLLQVGGAVAELQAKSTALRGLSNAFSAYECGLKVCRYWFENENTITHDEHLDLN